MYDVIIETIPSKSVVGLLHLGSYAKINNSFEKLFGLIDKAGIKFEWSQNQMLALYLDDPSSTPVEKLRSYAAITANDDSLAPPPLEKIHVRGEKYARLRFKGPYSELPKVYEWLYGTWLVATNEEAADAPCMEIYLNNPQDTPSAELLTDIYLPLI